MSTPFEVRAESVGVDLDGQVVLDDVSFVVSSSRMLVIVGPSGSGRSTLARVVAGVSRPDRGAITFGERTLDQLTTPAERPVFVPQDFGLVASLTASETIALPMLMRSFDKPEVRERSRRWLHAMGLEACAGRAVGELSGGQRQRVAIARALAPGAAMIVMDEPTAELDPANRDLVLSLLSAELERGALVVIASHESEIVARADALVELPAHRRGRSAIAPELLSRAPPLMPLGRELHASPGRYAPGLGTPGERIGSPAALREALRAPR